MTPMKTQKNRVLILTGLVLLVGVMLGAFASLDALTGQPQVLPTRAVLPTIVPDVVQEPVLESADSAAVDPQFEEEVAVETQLDAEEVVAEESITTEEEMVELPVEVAADLPAVEEAQAVAVIEEPQAPAPAVIEVPQEPVENQIVIRFDPSASEVEREAYIAELGGTVQGSIMSLDTVVVQVPATIAETSLPKSDAVAVTEPDYQVTALSNDPLYPEQWAIPVINAEAGWGVTANTVVVAVIDSGICASHPDLEGRVVAGYDFVEDDADPQDVYGHGCGVAGIIAANGENGIGIAGVAPNAQIMPLRVLDENGLGSYSDVAAAIVYAADNGAQIINLSLGGAYPSSMLEDALNYAAAQGVLTIAAAGNTGGSVLFPAAYDTAIAVASVDANLERSSFSSFGEEVALLAPGRDIYTIGVTGGFTTMTGTSFAAPQVAGIAALELGTGGSLQLTGGVVAFNGDVVVEVPPEETSQPPTNEPPSEPPAGDPLFVAVPAQTATDLNLQPLDIPVVLQERFVTVNFNLLGTTGVQGAQNNSLVLNLFDDVVFTATQRNVSTLESGGYVWSGTLDGLEYGEVDLVVNNGLVIGNVFTLNEVYEIRYSGQSAVHVIRQIEQGELPNEADVHVAPLGTDGRSPEVGASADTADTIDVMVVYSDDARAAAGGTAAIENEIVLAEQDTNQGYANSGIAQRIRVVHTAEVAYAETGDASTDLSRLRGSSDGYMDQVHALRDTHKADIVMLLVSNFDACGIAYFQSTISASFEAYAFGVVQQGFCSVSNHSFAHELGHIMGAHHDRYVVSPTPANTYYYGYVNTPDRWRTIMAYNNNCADLGFNCTRLRYWSNPEVSYNGDPMGVTVGLADAADNQRRLDESALTVANFRDGDDGTGNPPPNDDFNNAIVIGTPEYNNTQSTENATTAADDPYMGCYINDKHAHSVWYRYTAPEDGELLVATVDSDYDTVLGVFTGRRGSLTSIGCDDDGQGPQSILILQVQRGVTYYIEVAGFNPGDTGTLDFQLDFDPFNDFFSDAYEITRMTRYTQITEGAETDSSDPEFTCVVGQKYHSVWYKYTPTRTGYLTLHTNGSNFDTVLGVWTGTQTNLTNVACNDDGGSGTQSLIRDVVVEEGVTYYIEVAGYFADSFGRLYLTTSYSPPRTPARVALLSPRNNTYTNDTTPLLEWREAALGYEYEVEVATDSRFNNVVYTDTVIGLSDSTSTLSEGMYYWRVRAISELDAVGAWSGAWRFIVDTTPPYAPILRAPADGTSTTNNRPRFLWFTVPGAVAYDMQLDVENPPVTTVLDNGRNVYLPPSGLLVGTTYYWRARAVDAAGNVSAWSETWSVYFDSPANAVPVRNRYTDNTPTLTWNRVSWATEYELQIDDAANFRSLEYTATITAPTLEHTVSSTLPNGVYNWRVRARRPDGRWGAWSSPDNFVIDAP